MKLTQENVNKLYELKYPDVHCCGRDCHVKQNVGQTETKFLWELRSFVPSQTLVLKYLLEGSTFRFSYFDL